MEYRFLITYTIKEDNTKALNAITSFLTKYGFEKDEDQSTYLSKGKKCSLKEIQDALCGVKCHIKNDNGEHITLYYAKDNLIVRE